MWNVLGVKSVGGGVLKASVHYVVWVTTNEGSDGHEPEPRV